MKEAFHIAQTGRPGPVLLDITKDAQMGETEYEYPETLNMPGYRPTVRGHEGQIKQAASMINESERPGETGQEVREEMMKLFKELS